MARESLVRSEMLWLALMIDPQEEYFSKTPGLVDPKLLEDPPEDWK
jgi:hypothetical protein